MKRRAGLLLPFLAAACASAPVAPAPIGSPLAATIDSVTTLPPLDRTHWGIEVYDPVAGRWIHRLNPGKHFVPASNTKLVVTTVALGELGPEFRYRTELFAAAGPADSVAGGLLVVARGDPTLSARFHASELAPLEALADSVAGAGIRRIAGDLVVDASYFDDVRVNPSWEVGDLPWSYAAPVAAFGIAEGTTPVAIAPGGAAGVVAAVTSLAPGNAVVVRSTVVTDTAGARTRLDVVHRGDTLAITGTVPLDAAPDTVFLAVPDPAAYGARVFAAMLGARGVEVTGAVRVLDDPAAAAALRRKMPASPIATWSSPRLTEIVAAILQPSQNWIAEHLLKTLGAERADRGSWPAGIEVERRYLIDVVGIDSTAFTLRDGSGLSAQNLVTPHALVRLLDHARRQPWAEAYRAALAQPGLEESTLERRLAGLEGRVAAKTGTIAHVNALSGYIRVGNGRDLIFSILTNASGRPAGEVRQAIDHVVSAIARTGGSDDAT